MAPSPGPMTCAFPSSSTRQTDSSADDHLTQRVTSSRPAVGVACADQDLLGLTDALERPGRQDLELARRAGRRRSGGAAPSAIHSLRMRYSSELVAEPHAPLVGNRAGGLRQEQAAARVGQLDAPAAVLLDDVEEIGRRIIAPQREPEAPLAGQRTVAGTRVAPLLGQDRLDVIAKAPGERLAHAVHHDRGRGRPCAHLGGDRGLAVVDRRHDAVGDRGDPGIARRPLDPAA